MNIRIVFTTYALMAIVAYWRLTCLAEGAASISTHEVTGLWFFFSFSLTSVVQFTFPTMWGWWGSQGRRLAQTTTTKETR